MKIANSRVSMVSSHELETHVSVKKASLEVRAEDGARAKGAVAAIYEGSGESIVSAMEDYRKRQRSGRQPEESGTLRQSGRHNLQEPTCLDFKAGRLDFKVDEVSELKIALLNRLLEAIGGKGRIEPIRIGGQNTDALDLRGRDARTAGTRARMFGMSSFGFSAIAGFSAGIHIEGASVGTSSSGTLWQRIDAVSTERSEREFTAFQSRGCAVTENGRSISFDVEFAMSRAFSQRFDALSSKSYVMTDPLVINLDSNTTSVSDVKFRFDLDSDGKEDEISFAGGGSGFLALDANGNGKIDDGSELFGTKSGDGFADLAAHDEDGNGWIDENDSVYSKLRVWTRDEDGTDRLLDLKEANVGAIYLASVDTEFSLNSASTNETNGIIRRTGVYLKETGGAGTISHVDLSC